jgi:hypothetical protein
VQRMSALALAFSGICLAACGTAAPEAPILQLPASELAAFNGLRFDFNHLDSGYALRVGDGTAQLREVARGDRTYAESCGAVLEPVRTGGWRGEQPSSPFVDMQIRLRGEPHQNEEVQLVRYAPSPNGVEVASRIHWPAQSRIACALIDGARQRLIVVSAMSKPFSLTPKAFFAGIAGHPFEIYRFEISAFDFHGTRLFAHPLVYGAVTSSVWLSVTR